jgi:hypothetical protein
MELAAAASTKATSLYYWGEIFIWFCSTHISSEANLDNKVQALVLWGFVILHQQVQHPLETHYEFIHNQCGTKVNPKP